MRFARAMSLRHQSSIINKRRTDSCSAELKPLTICSSLNHTTCRVERQRQQQLLDCSALNQPLRSPSVDEWLEQQDLFFGCLPDRCPHGSRHKPLNSPLRGTATHPLALYQGLKATVVAGRKSKAFTSQSNALPRTAEARQKVITRKDI